MRKAVSVVIIKNGQILLVLKQVTWILPGGKPEAEEEDVDCLLREVGEELPGISLSNLRYFDSFTGVTPHKGDELRAEIYSADAEGDITPSAEISSAEWTNTPEAYKLSDITRKIVLSLRRNRYL
jgi:8-oxo-dGTP pyrophosphatase MutT (NUDIX family)